MSRPSLEIDVDVAGDAYGLHLSEDSGWGETDSLIQNPAKAPSPASRWPLFSLLSRQQRLFHLAPAILSSVFTGGIAPFMTIVIGHAFDAFSQFSTPLAPSEGDPKELLVHRVGIAALQLVGLALGSFSLSSLTSYLWILTGEHNVLELRKRVYASIAAKDMMWFDTRASDEQPSLDDEQGPLGAGGLMAQFMRETDEVRAASSLATGRIFEYLTTCITCLILALTRSYSLTLVILSAVPVLVIIQASSQAVAGPLLATERQQTAVAATLVDRAAAGISTVKAFTAAPHEQRALAAVLARMDAAVRRLVAVWGCTSGLAQFVMMALFVQGFWFGARGVRAGHIGAGDVMAVFWACLMAATNLQLCIPQFIILSRGKFALASLLALVDAEEDVEPQAQIPCHEEITLQDISFAYPSRPAQPILRAVTLVFPAHQTTFVVGASGSGKSTIAHLLAGLYAPQAGALLVDGRATDPRALDVAVVGQGQAHALLCDMSVHDNVALGRRAGSVGRAEVEAACARVRMHEFVRGLPEGYDTLLGRDGIASLSGGQAQRLALARAMLRDPDVLVLDEATSALDPSSRVAVFDAVRRWRQGRTTIVITHDLAQIGAEDFVYVLKDGCVVESGIRADLDTYVCGVFGSMVVSPAPVHQDAPPANPIVAEKTEHIPSSRPLPFGHLSLPTLSSAPSAMTRVARVAQFTPSIPSFSWHRTPNPYKPLPPPMTVFTRPPSLRFTPSDLVFEKRRDSFGSDLKVSVASSPSTPEGPSTLWDLLREMYPTIPHKPLVALGLVICLLSGATTPVFSFLLSRLLFEVSTGAHDTRAINTYGALALAVAALDGLLMGLKYFLMQSTAMAWVTRLRTAAYARVLRQDKRWFDGLRPGALGLSLIKDGDDARELLAGGAGQLLVVGAMFGVGLVWALLRGWQLALVGFAVVPVFGAAMAAQTGVVARCEVRNKRAAEEVAGRYYETISSIRGIRAMRFDGVFRAQFEKAAERALSVARKGAFVEGCSYGVACGLIYLAEAVLFYFGAVLVARGTYSYLQMVQVLNLVVFTVTIGSQLMAFTQRIAKSMQATRDFSELLRLPTRTDESDGFLRPRLDGAITFNDVGFSYPGHADAPVLQNINLQIQPGECVAIVGASGSGKTTIAALLQRLYEPAFGSISIGLDNLRSTDVGHLRQHVSIVSQQPTLFDATITENIAYGSDALTDADVRRAAEAANVHEFIMSLPQGYDTPVGENATLISGGQGQRLQIARALARPSKILILDECTSALDDANQAAVLDTIRHAKVGRTTVMITHKVPVMRMCDRLLVVHEGRIAETGTYDELIQRQGVFAALVRGESSFA
ncbi:P-loop containing nucleoside triphosphate hydrolase protein [Mycena albidolilacea]|uniref:P-loop containing nucleoside triphosphate hydrolase protein n=1 Tax=Mycena albidolilacea TaxID=1033008 RepID=A0AAD6Z0I7_9AGAR|nr:P-loop containing nucleoside triphosphate hydrolase protein [Mycena albidolilacea]